MNLYTVVFMCFVTTSYAQTIVKSSFKQLGHWIKDDGSTLQIKIDGQRANGDKLKYKRAFDITRLSLSQRDSLKMHVLDSLGVAYIFANPGRDLLESTSDHQDVKFLCSTCTKGNLEVYGHGVVSTRRIDGRDSLRKFPMLLALSPGDYRVVYYRNKRSGLIQKSFTVKKGDENVVTIH